MANLLFDLYAPVTLDRLKGLKMEPTKGSFLNLALSAFTYNGKGEDVNKELRTVLSDLLKACELDSSVPLFKVVFKNGFVHAVYEPSISVLEDEYILQLPTMNVKLSDTTWFSKSPKLTDSVQFENGLFYYAPDASLALSLRFDYEKIQAFVQAQKAMPLRKLKDMETKQPAEFKGLFKVLNAFPQKISAIMSDGTTYPMNFDADNIGAVEYEITSYRQYSNTYEGRTTTEFAVTLKGFPGEFRANKDIKYTLSCNPVCSEAQPILVVPTFCKVSKTASGIPYAMLSCRCRVTSASDEDYFTINY
jgi:hypothetical protein